MNSDPAVDTRVRLRAGTPWHYHWVRHVALITVFTAAGIVVPLRMLGTVGTSDSGAIVAMLLALVLGEYAAHRWSMHRRRFPYAVYHRHVVEHHAFFTDTRMVVDGWNDLRWVLFPPWALPLLVATVAPFAAALWALGAPRLAWLLLLVVIGYYGLYEIVHALAHMPVRRGRLGRMIAAVTHHHRVHHDPALMRRWNFNFVVPLGDWLWGTIWRDEAPRQQVSTTHPPAV